MGMGDGWEGLISVSLALSFFFLRLSVPVFQCYQFGKGSGKMECEFGGGLVLDHLVEFLVFFGGVEGVRKKQGI